MKIKRIIMSLSGVIITAISVGAFKFAAFGVDPFQSFMSGIDTVIPLDFGTLYVVVNAALLLFAVCFDRHYMGIATIMNLFLLGYVADWSQSILNILFPAPDFAIRIISFLFGFIFLCFGSSLYMTADMGVSTYDAIALIFANNWKLGKFKTVRIISDFACIALGLTMYVWGNRSIHGISAIVGFGTIVTAFCMGPLIDWINRKISGPLLKNSYTDHSNTQNMPC